jgi:hypothetical protein
MKKSIQTERAAIKPERAFFFFREITQGDHLFHKIGNTAISYKYRGEEIAHASGHSSQSAPDLCLPPAPAESGHGAVAPLAGQEP